MQLFLSTTFHGKNSTDIDEVLRLIDGLDIDGVELGSTHIFRADIDNIINERWGKRIVTHNFFPPAINQDFVMNIASVDSDVRNKSINHAKHCIEFAANIHASTYTIHPGFITDPGVNKNNKHTYDFVFPRNRVRKETAFSIMLDSLSILIETAIENNIELAIETEGSLSEPGVLLMETIEEYDHLFSIFPEHIYLNLNLAHTRFASIEHGFEMDDFIKQYYRKVVLVELSDNDRKVDQHLPLTNNSYVFNYLPLLPNVPHILEFRNATIDQVKNSITLMRRF